MVLDSAALCCQFPLTFRIYNLKFSPPNSGWDVHDVVYSRELLISNKANGYRDVIAEIDLSTYRRIPWEDNVPFFLVSFLDPDTRKPLPVCPRGVVSLVAKKAKDLGWTPMAGCEYEVGVLSFVGGVCTDPPRKVLSIQRSGDTS